MLKKWRHKYQNLRNTGKLHGTIKRAVALATVRLNASAEPNRRSPTCVLPLGSEDAATVEKLARVEYPRLKNWEGAEATVHSKDRASGWTVIEQDHGSYSRRCKWHRISYTPTTTSYCHAFGTRLIARIFTTRYKLHAPQGWKYGRDELGVYVVRKAEKRETFRYHLLSDDVRGGVQAVQMAGIAHEIGQRKAAKDQRLMRAATRAEKKILNRVGVWINKRDSQSAGNCRAGTAAFARQHGLNIERHYPAQILERLVQRHSSVLSVIRHAETRTLRELRAGFCNLNDH
jgi:hypothetical protein